MRDSVKVWPAETTKHLILRLKYAWYLPHVLLFTIDNCYPLFPVAIHLLFFCPRFLRTHESQEGVIRRVGYMEGNNKSRKSQLDLWRNTCGPFKVKPFTFLSAYIHVCNKAISVGLQRQLPVKTLQLVWQISTAQGTPTSFSNVCRNVSPSPPSTVFKRWAKTCLICHPCSFHLHSWLIPELMQTHLSAKWRFAAA